MRKITEIIIHCTATPEGKDYETETIRTWHKQRGFTDIGYHYVIHLDGRISIGRPIEQAGAHCLGHNSGSIGIVYVGGCTADMKHDKDTRTEAQKTALKQLVADLKEEYPTITKVSGHNQYSSKACPSFDVTKEFK